MALYPKASQNGVPAPPFFPASSYNLSIDECHNCTPEYSKPIHQINVGENQLQAPTSSSVSSSTSIITSLPLNCNLKILQDITSPEEQESNEILGPVGDAVYGNFRTQSQEQVNWMTSYEQQQNMGGLVPTFGNGAIGFGESQQARIPVVSAAMAANANSSESQKLADKPQSDEIVDKSKERRQKRMIKNRESAARSRAKKQAYINKLEDEVEQLQSANKRLKCQLEQIFKCAGDNEDKVETKHQLRRTSSAPTLISLSAHSPS